MSLEATEGALTLLTLTPNDAEATAITTTIETTTTQEAEMVDKAETVAMIAITVVLLALILLKKETMKSGNNKNASRRSDWLSETILSTTTCRSMKPT